MKKAVSSKFQNFQGGQTLEVLTPEAPAALLAYLDYLPEGMAEVTVFNTYKCTERRYAARPVAKAMGILERHLKAQGYEL